MQNAGIFKYKDKYLLKVPLSLFTKTAQWLRAKEVKFTSQSSRFYQYSTFIIKQIDDKSLNILIARVQAFNQRGKNHDSK